MRFFPPVVTGPIIISIGLILAPSAIANASTNWLLAAPRRVRARPGFAMKFCPTVAEMAAMSPMCSIMAARAMGMIAAVILVSALGFNSVGGLTLFQSESLTISLSGLAIAAILGIALNAVLPVRASTPVFSP